MVDRDPSTISKLAQLRDTSYQVYEPAEDSAVLTGEVVNDLGGNEPLDVLDVGTGSGFVGVRVSEATNARVVGIDVNPAACRRARLAGLETVCGDLVSPIDAASFDVVMFNPPYLPATPEAQWDDWFETAVTGGDTGRELIDRFVDSVGRILRPDGVVYVLVSSLTGVDEVVERVAEHGFSAVALADASFPGETLTVLKLVQ